MTIPMVITTCSPMVMRVVDFAFVSTLGREAQAAIIPAQIALWCYMAACIGLVSAVSTYASQCLGRDRLADCSAYGWQSVYLSVFLGVLGLGLLPVFPVIFAWVDHEPQVMAMEVLYTQVSVWAILPTVAAQALGAYFTGIHRPRVTMVVALEANALNILLDYALIFGALGCPQMGFRGAALGTVIAAFYQTARLLATLWWGESRRVYAARRTLAIDWGKLGDLVRVGGPQGLQWLSDVTVWGLFNMFLIGRFGTAELAASNIAWQYIRISLMPIIGVGQAITVMVGRAIGQGNFERARRFTRIGIAISFAYSVVVLVVYVSARPTLIGLFTDDPTVLAVGVKVMLCVALFQWFDVLGTSYYHALRGAGDTRWPMVMFVVSHWAVIIGGGSIVVWLRPDLGSLGPWMVATVLISFTGALLWWRWNSRAWMRINLFRDAPQPPPGGRAPVAVDAQPIDSLGA